MPRRLASNRDDGLALEADINITSMVDVAFTLLVIFIITAPILQGGIEVNLPQADVAPLTPTDEPVFVSIDAEGRIFLEQSEFESLDAFREQFGNLAEVGGWEVVYVRADADARHGVVGAVYGAIAAAGVGVASVMESLDEGR